MVEEHKHTRPLSRTHTRIHAQINKYLSKRVRD